MPICRVYLGVQDTRSHKNYFAPYVKDVRRVFIAFWLTFLLLTHLKINGNHLWISYKNLNRFSISKASMYWQTCMQVASVNRPLEFLCNHYIQCLTNPRYSYGEAFRYDTELQVSQSRRSARSKELFVRPVQLAEYSVLNSSSVLNVWSPTQD